jgi:hypothetical protein
MSISAFTAIRLDASEQCAGKSHLALPRNDLALTLTKGNYIVRGEVKTFTRYDTVADWF